MSGALHEQSDTYRCSVCTNVHFEQSKAEDCCRCAECRDPFSAEEYAKDKYRNLCNRCNLSANIKRAANDLAGFKRSFEKERTEWENRIKFYEDVIQRKTVEIETLRAMRKRS